MLASYQLHARVVTVVVDQSGLRAPELQLLLDVISDRLREIAESRGTRLVGQEG